MPNYEYICDCTLKYRFERFLSIDNRDIPTRELCPQCGKPDSIKRQQGCGVFVHDMKDPLTRAGDGFKEVQQKIIAGAGRGHTIRTK